MSNIYQLRRQQFLTESLFKNAVKFLVLDAEYNQEVYEDNITGDDYTSVKRITRVKRNEYHHTLWYWLLDYTAGKSIEGLAPEFAKVVDAFVAWNKQGYLFNDALNKVNAEFDEDDLEFDLPSVDLRHGYYDFMQVFSIAVLLRDFRSVGRIARIMQHRRGWDTLIEHFFGEHIPAQFHDEYGLMHKGCEPLLKVFESEDKGNAAKLINQYVKKWYSKQKEATWYEGHVEGTKEDGYPYFGYWSMEAGVTAYLNDVDDSSITHMVYPKDLVDYAKQLKAEGKYTTPPEQLEESLTKYRCEAGKKCPKTGDWYSPANQNLTTRHFEEGQVMPDIPDNPWGQVIWYLDDVVSD